MAGRTIWKLLVTALVLAWAISNLIPFEERPLKDYVLESATAEQAELEALVIRAEEALAQKEGSSLYSELLGIINEEEIDLSKYYPQIELIHTKNVQRRNEMLLNHLLDQSLGAIRYGLDLRGGVSGTLEVNPNKISDNEHEQKAKLDKVIEIMGERVRDMKISEPVIRAKSESAIEIQLPGVSTRNDPTLFPDLAKAAKLEFRMVHRYLNPATTPEEDTPVGYEVLIEEGMDKDGKVTEEAVFVELIPLANGSIIDEAWVRRDEFGAFQIVMDFTSDGSKEFGDLTAEIARNNRPPHDIGRLAIVLDGKLYSSPTVRESLDGGQAYIHGSNITEYEAYELANVLNNPLEEELVLTETAEVDATLAEDSKESSINAAMLGAGLVIVFMLLYYTYAGVIGVVTVGLNLVFVIGTLASMSKYTITLPGVAALVLTIGMAVDASILIFERIREELRAGKSLEGAVEGGFDKAFSTIIDANVTTLITAVILIKLGTGPVEGFGITLACGIIGTVIFALITSRALMELLVSSGVTKKLWSFALFTPQNYQFDKARKPAFAASWLIVLIGVFVTYQAGDKALGIDFKGGDEITLNFEERIEPKAIETLAEEKGLGEVIPGYRVQLGDAEKEVLKIQTESGQGKAVFAALEVAYAEAGLALVGETTIGASVTERITTNAIVSVLAALGGILLYIALRFELGYGVGAVVATVHDVAMTIGIFVLLGQYLEIGSGQFTSPMLAAILMIVGYSINDTIVVFDRIREELDLNPTVNLKKVMNIAINRTLSRTLLTSITTFLAALSLFIFGAGVVTDFALVFLIGILTGTFSSIFIASPVFYWWHKGDRRHVEERELLPKYDWQVGSKDEKEKA